MGYKILSIVIIGVVIVIFGYFITVNPVCDSISFNFYELYVMQNDNVEEGFNSMIGEYVLDMQNCKVIAYSKIEEDEYNSKLFDEYSISVYNVSYSCNLPDVDEINFYILVHKRGNVLYLFSMGNAPCDNKNHVYFKNMTSQFTFDEQAIEANVVNFDFCTKYENSQLNGDNESCYTIQAMLAENEDEAIQYCDQITWTPTRAGCYEKIVMDLWWSNPSKAKLLCDRLNASISMDDPHKYYVEFCYENY